MLVRVQKDPSKADDFHGERGAGDADTIDVVTGADGERGDGDENDEDETA